MKENTKRTLEVDATSFLLPIMSKNEKAYRDKSYWKLVGERRNEQKTNIRVVIHKFFKKSKRSGDELKTKRCPERAAFRSQTALSVPPALSETVAGPGIHRSRKSVSGDSR